MNRAILLGAALVLSLVVSGCCQRPEVAGALVVNNTDKTVTVSVVEEPDGYGPWTIEPGLDETVISAPGARTLRFAVEGQPAQERKLDMTLEGLLLVPAKADSCMALADHTDQYGGEGRVEVVAASSPQKPGVIKYLEGNYLGPEQPLPPDVLKGHKVARFTEVPCELMGDEKALHDHLWALD